MNGDAFDQPGRCARNQRVGMDRMMGNVPAFGAQPVHILDRVSGPRGTIDSQGIFHTLQE